MAKQLKHNSINFPSCLKKFVKMDPNIVVMDCVDSYELLDAAADFSNRFHYEMQISISFDKKHSMYFLIGLGYGIGGPSEFAFTKIGQDEVVKAKQFLKDRSKSIKDYYSNKREEERAEREKKEKWYEGLSQSEKESVLEKGKKRIDKIR